MSEQTPILTEHHSGSLHPKVGLFRLKAVGHPPRPTLAPVTHSHPRDRRLGGRRCRRGAEGCRRRRLSREAHRLLSRRTPTASGRAMSGSSPSRMRSRPHSSSSCSAARLPSSDRGSTSRRVQPGSSDRPIVPLCHLGLTVAICPSALAATGVGGGHSRWGTSALGPGCAAHRLPYSQRRLRTPRTRLREQAAQVPDAVPERDQLDAGQAIRARLRGLFHRQRLEVAFP